MPASADLGQVLGVLNPAHCKPLASRAGASVKWEGRAKRVPGASVSRFLPPPWPQIPRHTWWWRAGVTVPERSVKRATSGSDTDWPTLESPRRRSWCQAPTHTGDRSPLPPRDMRVGWTDHWLRPPNRPPILIPPIPRPPTPCPPPPPTLTALGWRRWAPRARTSAPSRSSLPYGRRRSCRAPRREAAPLRWARWSNAAPGRGSTAAPAGPALLRQPPEPAFPAAPLRAPPLPSDAPRRPGAAGLRVGAAALLSRRSCGLGPFNSPRQQRRDAALRSFALLAAPWKRRGSPVPPAAQASRPGRAQLRKPRSAIAPASQSPAFRRSRFSRLRSAAFSHAGPSPQPPPGSRTNTRDLSRSLASVAQSPPVLFPSRVARSGSQAPSRWVMQIT